ncbi:thiolase family protein [Alkalihalobacterium chitinilyticum]|uniref:acetyl-CoA C-acetyltransferase n=1 Tax=Alkalihalobacterium chitinilyticum TaxID=2980103 RepID=A0ABT5V9I2_9BACI|nr:thiolase family protein [Alkalihalobacterium chitinilyticum]MDE5412119.1 thiolase family protein [Alkalihalobacterium chitinilyticum]
MNNIYILDGARTAFTAFGGSFQSVNATELGTVTAVEALKRAEVEGKDIDQVVYGNVIHSSTNAAYLARHIALKADVPMETPALTVNRLCGSGMQSIISAAQSIRLGESNLALVGGAENMTMSPHSNFTSRFSGVKYGSFQFEDMLLNTLTDQYTGIGMGITAENLAEKYEISREEQDEFALLSQQRATEAIQSGIFAEEITAVEVSSRGGSKQILEDEHVKKDMTFEKLAALKPSFRKDGTVTAGNASGINDGAASLILSSEAEVKKRNQKPLAKIVSWGIAGVDPSIMGIGPVPAIQQALQRAELTLEQMDRIEINEAFAAQYLAVEKELGLDRNKTNVHGGAIALGHPVGASGSRIVLSLANELRRNGLRYGVASLCIGGGQGIAVVIENENV